MFIKELKWDINLDDLLSYYNTVKKDFNHLKWSDKMFNDVVDTEKHKVNGVYGWGIQSNLVDITKPCPPYNISKHSNEDFKDTKLVFGFITQVKEKFPQARQISISGHPPGVLINQHIDTPAYIKIHIPIYTNQKAFFIFGNKRYNLKQGKAYLVNTTIPHGVYNNGNTDRVHLMFKVPTKEYYELFV